MKDLVVRRSIETAISLARDLFDVVQWDLIESESSGDPGAADRARALRAELRRYLNHNAG